MKPPKELMKKWYGKQGLLAQSGFKDVENFSRGWEPEDALHHSPASPEPVEANLDEAQTNDMQYTYFLRWREAARRLEQGVFNAERQEEWILANLWGDGEPMSLVSEALDLSTTAVRRLIRKLETKWKIRL